MDMHDILVCFGGELKALGDDRFGGWAVVFGDESKTDLSPHRDFMTPETDFWVDDDEWGRATAPVIFHHGLDPTMKKLRLGRVTYERKDAGIWAEGILKLRADYKAQYGDHMKAIADMIAAGELGLSTGVPGHLVEREKRGSAHWLKTWPIERSELSLTPTPAEPRTSVVALKSLQGTDGGRGAAAAPSFAETSRRLVADTREFVALAAKLREQRAAEGRDLSPEKRAALKALADEHRALLRAIEGASGPPEVDRAAFRETIRRARLTLRAPTR